MICNQHRHSTVEPRVSLLDALFGIVLAALLATAARGADQPARPGAKAELYVTSGHRSIGEIRSSGQAGVVRWQSVGSDAPRDFAWNDLNAIEWPPAPAQPKPTGDFRFELAAGDVLFGSLLALNEQQAELDVPRLGRIHVPRANLHRIDQWRDGAVSTYQGPNGLAGWHELNGQKNWRDDSGRPMTDREGAAIVGDFKLPARARIEFEISWKSKPDFIFALGVDDTAESAKRAFKFEAWGSDLIIQRELPDEADLNIVQELDRGPRRCRFQAYIDQEIGRIFVFSSEGKQLSNLRVGSTRRAALPGLSLVNLGGDVRLDSLRIGPWNGEVPTAVPPGLTRIISADGSAIDGQLTGFDAASKEFQLKTQTGERRIAFSQVSSVLLAGAGNFAPPMIRAVLQDGSRLSGEPGKVEDGALALTVPGIREPLRLRLESLRSLVVIRNGNPPGKAP